LLTPGVWEAASGGAGSRGRRPMDAVAGCCCFAEGCWGGGGEARVHVSTEWAFTVKRRQTEVGQRRGGLRGWLGGGLATENAAGYGGRWG